MPAPKLHIFLSTVHSFDRASNTLELTNVNTAAGPLHPAAHYCPRPPQLRFYHCLPPKLATCQPVHGLHFFGMARHMRRPGTRLAAHAQLLRHSACCSLQPAAPLCKPAGTTALGSLQRHTPACPRSTTPAATAFIGLQPASHHLAAPLDTTQLPTAASSIAPSCSAQLGTRPGHRQQHRSCPAQDACPSQLAAN